MKVRAYTTGAVRITENWVTGRGSGIVRMFNTLTDNRRTDWLPIWCFVIEHPEGLIVVDTGIPEDANKPIYFPPHMLLVQRAAEFRVGPQDVLANQMRADGLDPNAVRWVIATHLHQDHDGGLADFGYADLIVSRTELEAGEGVSGRMNGYMPWRWPDRMQQTAIEFDDTPYVSFTRSKTLTQRGDVTLVPTPGHSPGHMSVVLDEGDHYVMFAGDAAYSQAQLLKSEVDGVSSDPIQQLESQQRIRKLAETRPTVFLPAHDPDSAMRLQQRLALDVVPVPA